MYYIEIRLYSVTGKIYASAEYRRDYRQNQDVVTTAHCQWPVAPDSPLSAHEENLLVAGMVCQELAQNLGLPLY